ncbi:MAG: hypothetical protein ACE5K4_03035 [Candidatus Hydrothermarchaeota archaeon]
MRNGRTGYSMLSEKFYKNTRRREIFEEMDSIGIERKYFFKLVFLLSTSLLILGTLFASISYFIFRDLSGCLIGSFMLILGALGISGIFIPDIITFFLKSMIEKKKTDISPVILRFFLDMVTYLKINPHLYNAFIFATRYSSGPLEKSAKLSISRINQGYYYTFEEALLDFANEIEKISAPARRFAERLLIALNVKEKDERNFMLESAIEDYTKDIRLENRRKVKILSDNLTNYIYLGVLTPVVILMIGPLMFSVIGGELSVPAYIFLFLMGLPSIIFLYGIYLLRYKPLLLSYGYIEREDYKISRLLVFLAITLFCSLTYFYVRTFFVVPLFLILISIFLLYLPSKGQLKSKRRIEELEQNLQLMPLILAQSLSGHGTVTKGLEQVKNIFTDKFIQKIFLQTLFNLKNLNMTFTKALFTASPELRDSKSAKMISDTADLLIELDSVSASNSMKRLHETFKSIDHLSRELKLETTSNLTFLKIINPVLSFLMLLFVGMFFHLNSVLRERSLIYFSIPDPIFMFVILCITLFFVSTIIVWVINELEEGDRITLQVALGKYNSITQTMFSLPILIYLLIKGVI